MQKLRKYLNEKITANFFIAIFTIIFIGTFFAFLEYKSLNYNFFFLFLIVYFSFNSIFYIPAIFQATLFYTLNANFPKIVLDEYKINEKTLVKIFSSRLIIFLFLTIFFIELISPFYFYFKEKLDLKEAILNSEKITSIEIKNILKEADNFLNKNEFYKALDIYYEILIRNPNYSLVKDKINSVREKMESENEKNFKDFYNEGLKYFNEKKYKEAAEFFRKALNIKPDSKDALKYYNLSLNEIDISKKKLIKDWYRSIITLQESESNLIFRERKINELTKEGIKEFKNKNYDRAKELFKNILKELPENYGAFYYLDLINQRLSQISYLTSINGKLIKENRFYITKDNRILFVSKLGKSFENEYLFYGAEFYNLENGLRKVFSKRYGYYDYKLKKFIFTDEPIKLKDAILLDNINPAVMWKYEEVIKNPEYFSLNTIFELKDYFGKSLKLKIKNIILFEGAGRVGRIILAKILLYFFIGIFYGILMDLAIIFRRRSGGLNLRGISLFFIPFLVIILSFINSFFWKLIKFYLIF